jgi:hypothetical protein
MLIPREARLSLDLGLPTIHSEAAVACRKGVYRSLSDSAASRQAYQNQQRRAWLCANAKTITAKCVKSHGGTGPQRSLSTKWKLGTNNAEPRHWRLLSGWSAASTSLHICSTLTKSWTASRGRSELARCWCGNLPVAERRNSFGDFVLSAVLDS